MTMPTLAGYTPNAICLKYITVAILSQAKSLTTFFTCNRVKTTFFHLLQNVVLLFAYWVISHIIG